MKNRQVFVDDLRTLEPGTTVQAVLMRDGQEITVYVELQAANNNS
jgi:S1-C subfamily serine protease